MDSIIDSENKVQKICDEIRKNTLEPALKEAQEIEQHAKKHAEQILVEANEKKQQIIASAQKEIDQRQKVFENALAVAKKRAIENIKEHVEKSLFNPAFSKELKSATIKEETLSAIIRSLMKVIEESGADESLLFVPNKTDIEKVAALLAKDTAENLKEKMVLSDQIQGGVKLALKNKHLTLDFSDEAIGELIAKYIRKEFRELLFK